MPSSFEKGPAPARKELLPEEKLADAKNRLARHLEVAGSEEDKNEKTKNFYLNELGYKIEGKGLLRGKVRLLDQSKSDQKKKEYVIDPETGKPKEFKTYFKLPKGETPLVGFLKEELMERLGVAAPDSKEKRFQNRLKNLWEGKKGPRDLKRLKEINEKIEQAGAPWVARVMYEIKKINKNHKEFKLLKVFKPEDVDNLQQMSRNKGWNLSEEGIDTVKTKELAFDFMKGIDPVFKERLDLLSGKGKIEFEFEEIAHLYELHKKAEAADAPWVFGLLKEMILRGKKNEVMRLRPDRIDDLKRTAEKNPDIRLKEGLTKEQFNILMSELG